MIPLPCLQKLTLDETLRYVIPLDQSTRCAGVVRQGADIGDNPWATTPYVDPIGTPESHITISLQTPASLPVFGSKLILIIRTFFLSNKVVSSSIGQLPTNLTIFALLLFSNLS